MGYPIHMARCFLQRGSGRAHTLSARDFLLRSGSSAACQSLMQRLPELQQEEEWLSQERTRGRAPGEWTLLLLLHLIFPLVEGSMRAAGSYILLPTAEQVNEKLGRLLDAMAPQRPWGRQAMTTLARVLSFRVPAGCPESGSYPCMPLHQQYMHEQPGGLQGMTVMEDGRVRLPGSSDHSSQRGFSVAAMLIELLFGTPGGITRETHVLAPGSHARLYQPSETEVCNAGCARNCCSPHHNIRPVEMVAMLGKHLPGIDQAGVMERRVCGVFQSVHAQWGMMRPHLPAEPLDRVFESWLSVQVRRVGEGARTRGRDPPTCMQSNCLLEFLHSHLSIFAKARPPSLGMHNLQASLGMALPAQYQLPAELQEHHQQQVQQFLQSQHRAARPQELPNAPGAAAVPGSSVCCKDKEPAVALAAHQRQVTHVCVVCVCVCVYMCARARVRVFVYLCTWVFLHMHARVRVYMFVCVCVCVCVWWEGGQVIYT